MFSLILLFCLTFSIPVGKLFDVFYWNTHIIPVETSHSFRDTSSHSTIRLSAKRFCDLQQKKPEYFFHSELIPLLEKCLFSKVFLNFIHQEILFSGQNKKLVYQTVFNVSYPNEKMS